MGRNIDDFLLEFTDLDGKWFLADEAGVTQLKREVRQRAKEILWLRKGEDFGTVIQMLFEAWNAGSDAITLMWNAYSLSPDVDLSDITLEGLKSFDLMCWWLLYKEISKNKELLIKDAKSIGKILFKAMNWVRGPNIRILCCKDEINLRAELGWRALRCEIRRYVDESTSGTHRYYLSDQEFAFFIRQPDKSFLGFHSQDSGVIKVLRESFEIEWKKNV